MFVECNFERQPETTQSARGDTRTKRPPRSWEWSVYLCVQYHQASRGEIICSYNYVPSATKRTEGEQVAAVIMMACVVWLSPYTNCASYFAVNLHSDPFCKDLIVPRQRKLQIILYYHRRRYDLSKRTVCTVVWEMYQCAQCPLLHGRCDISMWTVCTVV